MDWREAVVPGELIALAVNAVLVCLILMTQRWWNEPREQDALRGGFARAPFGSARASKWWWILLVLPVGVAGWLRWDFAKSSLWWDEVWQVRNASIGEWKPVKRKAAATDQPVAERSENSTPASGVLANHPPKNWKWHPTSWSQALWQYRKPTNHPPMALAQKVCHEIWRKITNAQPGRFNEFVLRLPGFAASLAAVALLGILMRLWGFPWAGLLAAFLLAMHPWHVRYGIEARGYTLVVLLTISGMVMLTLLMRGLGTGNARQAGSLSYGVRRDDAGAGRQAGSLSYAPMWLWWLFGLNQALIVWSHLFSAWVCAALAATAAWWIWRNSDGPARRSELCRLAVANLAAAGLFLQLFMPNILQALRWGERNRDGSVLDWNYFVETLTQVAAGCRGFAAYHDIEAAVVLILLFVFGAWWLWRRNRTAAALSGGLLITGAAVLAIVALTGMYFYHRFVVALIVPWCVLMSLGLVAPAACIVSTTKARGLVIFAAWFGYLWLTGMFVTTWGDEVVRENRHLSATPISPLRETAAFLRARESAGDAIFAYGFGSEALQYYLPELPFAREADAPELLEAALKAADDAGKPLVVAVGYEELNRRQLAPGGFPLLDDPERFEEIGRFPGIEPLFGYRVLASRPARR